MSLDRSLQLKLLEYMAAKYPYHWDFYNDFPEGSENYEAALRNLYYLMQHELVEKKSLTLSNYNGTGFNLIIHLPTISQKGMDFLADDGGLSAILGVVTIKFEADTLRTILERRINQAEATPEHKQSMIDGIRELPAESIKHLTMKLLDEGLDNLPNAIVLIGTYLGLS
ncbi:hypothetical protein QLH32_05640 [Acinetobacter corruptisaponis]|uniref:Uncharacterized protein n=1 Tax=Acinetobacter corruptisaponis TaxID=3045147 RepID=A0ABY8S787_9GAMM|nr:hypothetical protein [Acinetobacter sp. KCTC 92772]WHP06870.1 hypothetical protein QLH32_05210 [Acinetobacter sp. KCTC 92772]WHP06948.1 hypothetical protein QLH32_05640 [Acinetobacter sp. KCTC 92772]